MVRGSIDGWMAGCMMGNGRIIRCTAEGFIPGLMEGGTREIMREIKSRVRGSIPGLMGGFMRGSGWMENRMGRESTCPLRGLLKLGFGRTGRGFNGSKRLKRSGKAEIHIHINIAKWLKLILFD